MDNYKFIDKKREHMHTLDGAPLIGTSTVVGVISKPLTWWAAETAAVECLEAGEKIPTIRQEYEEAVASGDKKAGIDALQKKYPIFKKARFAHYESKNDKADKGTDMHEALELYIKDCIAMNEIMPSGEDDSIFVKSFAIWSKENVEKFLVSEGHCYSKELWTGGIVDCMVRQKNGQEAIIDFKSSREAFDSQFIQIAGYDLEQAENGIFEANGGILQEPVRISAYIVIPFGAKEFKVEKRYNTEEYKEAFKAANKLYKILNK
ncbi:MAG TPA: hypothetical protein VIJ14_00940 [Rhabdochlamydiaceae bacterium]